MNKTNEVIAKMLKENTGRSMLDSGDYYGRHYERNQYRDFESESPIALSFDTWRDNELEISVTRNLYHWLTDKLEYSEELTNLLYETDESGDYRTWESAIDAFYTALIKRYETDQLDSEGCYTEEYKEFSRGDSGYTYNHENNLSQDFIYYEFSLDGDPYVILQIHNGCDARGGFTSPKVFSVLGDEYDLYMFNDSSISCPNCPTYWYTDGYHWYFEGSSRKTDLSFESLKILNTEDIDIDDMSFTEYVIKRFGTAFYFRWLDRYETLRKAFYTIGHKLGLGSKLGAYKRNQRILVITEENEAYCPNCGKAKLSAY